MDDRETSRVKRRAKAATAAPGSREKRRAEVRTSRVDGPMAVACLLVVSLVAFLPVLRSQFVNWDDPFTLQNNQHLGSPGIVRWALTTNEMGHYQPLAWVAWSLIKTWFGLDPFAFHLASLLGHLVNAVLVYLLTLALASAAGVEPRPRTVAALVASLMFAVHPLRVEAVAWVSAFPYVLALGPTLAAVLAYVRYAQTPAGVRLTASAKAMAVKKPDTTDLQRGWWLVVSVLAYVLSLLSRANGIGLPFVLFALDAYPLRRPLHLVEKIPFFAAAAVSGLLEFRARDLSSLSEVGLGARLTLAASAPFRYVWRTLVPVRLLPIDPMPIEPRVLWSPLILGVIGLVAVTVVAWKFRERWPAVLTAWLSYILLLAPVVGLTPSGLQATADRYVYLPAVALAIGLGAAVACGVLVKWRPALAGPTVIGIVVVTALGAATWHQAQWWHDSIVLWTRAADLDPTDDIATYNLAVALADSGRANEAIAQYQRTLQLVPDQDLARRNLNTLLAARGMASMRAGRFTDAASDLRSVFAARPEDRNIGSALGFVLVQTNRPVEAVTVLERALVAHPDDAELAANLARVLATSDDSGVRDPAKALQFALVARDRTGGSEPRVLDTLAAAYAATGQPQLARQTLDQAIAIARQRGDAALASEIASHAERYGR